MNLNFHMSNIFSRACICDVCKGVKYKSECSQIEHEGENTAVFICQDCLEWFEKMTIEKPYCVECGHDTREEMTAYRNQKDEVFCVTCAQDREEFTVEDNYLSCI